MNRREQTPALVLGGDYTGLGVSRSLGSAGIPVFIAAPRGDFAVWSRWNDRLRLPAPESSDPGLLASVLRELPSEQAVLFPCTDLWCEAVVALPEELRGRFPTVTGSQSAVEILLDKGRFAEVVENLGIPHPRTYAADRFADLSGLEGARFLLKPRSSQRFARAFNRKSFVVDNRHDAEEAMRRAAEEGLEMVFQEHIPGPATAIVLIDGFVDRRASARGRFARRRVHAYPPDLGNTTYTVSIPLAEVAGAAKDVDRLLDAIGYRGLYSAELKYDERDGAFKLLEVNCRPWWHLEFSGQCGLNLALLAYRDALGLPIEPAGDYRVGSRRILALVELKALNALLRERRLSPAGWALGYLGLARTVMHPEDPLPAVAHVAGPAVRVVRWARRVGR